jgi:hypothetical protein
MQVRRFAFYCLVLLNLIACEARQPMDRYLVVTMGDSLQRREGLSWGDPIDVLGPDRADADGHKWWQITYKDGPRGESRMILVDAHTGWARFPGPDYHPRVAIASSPLPLFPHQAQTGAFILLVTGATTYDAGSRPTLEAEVRQLNEMAKNTGLYPLFEVREARGQGVQIVYGWQKDGGIQRDERVRDWLHVRTRFDKSVWVRLDEWK